MSLNDRVKDHVLVVVATAFAAGVGIAWSVSMAIVVGPKDDEITRKSELIGRLGKEVDELEQKLAPQANPSASGGTKEVDIEVDYSVRTNDAIAHHNDIYIKKGNLQLRPQDCAWLCTNIPFFECRSFDYYNDSSACDLSRSTMNDPGVTSMAGDTRYTHYGKRGN